MLEDVSEMRTYFALVRKEPGSDYGVDFTDFPGCINAGTTFEEACLMASEALQFHIEGMVEDGALIPAQTSLDVIMSDPRNTDAIAIQVSVPIHFQQVTR